MDPVGRRPQGEKTKNLMYLSDLHQRHLWAGCVGCYPCVTVELGLERLPAELLLLAAADPSVFFSGPAAVVVG